jgi:hypothetical protein
MVSSNKAGLNLRENAPLPRTLHNAPQRLTRQRPNPSASQTGYRGWLSYCASPKDDAGHLIYPASGRDSAKSGKGCMDNRHLSYLAKTIFVNVGGSQLNAKVSNPPMFVVSVGAVIVVRAWESQAQGEGPQSVATSKANVIECQHRGISYEYRRNAKET